MESIEKLRTVARNMAKGMNLEEHDECNLLLVIADEIERERKQRINELNGAICERDGRIGSYERRNTELNDALKAICKHFGVSVEWSAEDAAKKVLEALDRDYMRLPCDADGVPIHVGDLLASDEYGGRRFPCRGMSVDVRAGGKYWTVCLDYDSYSGTSEWCAAHRCHHVKPDPLKELLNDHLQEREKIVRKLESNLITLGEAESEEDACDKLFAERIRELLGGEHR